MSLVRVLLAIFGVIGLLAGGLACGKRKTDQGGRPAPITGSPAAGAGGAGPHGTASQQSASGGAAAITGRILLDDARKGNVAPTDTVYLVARRPAETPGVRGSLVAVKRFPASSFPIDFTLGPGDMMFKNGEFEGELTLSARIDKDGDPITRKKGDVFGVVDRAKVGSRGVDIRIDTVQNEDESLAAGPGHGTSR